MQTRHRIALVLAFTVLASLGILSTARADTLTQRYPADADGIIRDTQITELASELVGWHVDVTCSPPPLDGIDDAGAPINASVGRTDFYADPITGDGEPGTVYLVDPPTAIDLNGEICGALDRLLDTPAGWFKRPVGFVVQYVEPVPRPTRTPSAHGGQALRTANTVVPELELETEDQRVIDAAFALLTLRHETLHVRLAGQTPFVDTILPDGADSAPALNEGIVECAAIRNVWPLITRLTRVAWLRRALLASARESHLEAPDVERTVC